MPKKNKIRVVLDTNLWISHLISKRLGKVDELFARENLVVLFSAELRDEFIEVAQRPKFQKYFSSSDLVALLDLFDAYGEMIQVQRIVNACRDDKDNFLLALAAGGRADFLLTGDNDLLVLEKFEATEI